MTRARLLALALVTAAVVAACGKTATPAASVAGVYHLIDSDQPTNLELRADGTFTLRRESCESAGGLECGAWRSEIAGNTQVVARDGLYWPTPDEFPSAVVRTLSLRRHGEELEVVGRSEWAGTFRQKWVAGRTCGVCGMQRGVRTELPCNEPLPACTPP